MDILRQAFSKKSGRLLLLAYIVLACSWGIKGVKKGSIKGNDSWVYFGAARTILTGENIYTVDYPVRKVMRPYIYPPMTACALIPLATLGNNWAGGLWGAINVGVVFLLIFISIQLCIQKEAFFHKALALIPLAITLRPFDSDIGNGQINSMVFFCMLLGLYFFQRKKDALSGIFFALATSIKLTPLIFLGYFLYKREWRVCSGFLVGILLFIFLLPSAIIGWQRNNELLKSFSNKMIIAQQTSDNTVDGLGHSLHGVMTRYFSATENAYHSAKSLRVNVLDINTQTMGTVTKIVSMLLLALVAIACRRKINHREEFTWRFEVSLIIMTMLLISPLSRKAHFASMLFPVTVLVHYCFSNQFKIARTTKKLLLGVLAFNFIFLTVVSTPTVGKTVNAYLLAYSTFFWGAALIWLALFIILLTFQDRSIFEKTPAMPPNAT